MVKYKLLVICLFLCLNSFAQETAEGIVVDKNTGLPIPYVNISLKGKSSIGTISNLEGKFRIALTGDSVIFSHIGFKRKAISTDQVSRLAKVKLEESENMLSEVVVMNDSSLLQMLRKAFAKVETNYPSDGTLVEGFFRETSQVVEDHKFIYFSESTIEFFKPGYSNKRFGRVRLVKGAKSEITDRSKYSNVYFYSGVYVPQTFDFVKQRADFINPDYFNKYEYSLVRITRDGDREIMEIKFKPRVSASSTGSFQLDRKTLAYIGAQFTLTESGLRDFGSSLQQRKYTEAIRDIRYRQIDGAWNLSVAIVEATLYNPTYKNHLRTTREFVATSITPSDHDPIKESEAISYSDIYSLQDTKFNNDYWKEDKTIKRDSALQQEVDLLFEKNPIVNEGGVNEMKKEINVVKKKNKADKLVKLVSRFGCEFGIGAFPVEVQPGMWTVDYADKSYSKNVSSTNFVWSFDQEFSFRLNHAFVASIHVASGLSKEKSADLTRLVLNYRKRIVGWKHPLWLYAGVGIGSTSVKQSVTDEVNINRITTSVMPSLQLNYKFSNTFGLLVGATLSAPFKTSDKLYVLEKKNFFGSTYDKINLNDPSVNFRINGDDRRESGIDLTKTPIFLRMGVFYRL